MFFYTMVMFNRWQKGIWSLLLRVLLQRYWWISCDGLQKRY